MNQEQDRPWGTIFRLWCVAGLCVITVFVGLAFAVLSSLLYMENTIAKQDARSYTDVLNIVQSFYSREIVQKAKSDGIVIAKDFRDLNQPSLPFPATFTHELIGDLNQRNPDLTFRFFSEFPFFQRKDSGPQNAFERRALEFFKQSDATEYYEDEQENGVDKLRFARALRMESQCISCHNSHPDSPKKDWKEGQLRGVQSIVMPMANIDTLTLNTWRFPLYYIAAFGAGISFVILILFFYASKYLKQRAVNDEIQKKNIELEAVKAKVERIAYYDPTSGLPNRLRFNEMLEEAINHTSGASNDLVLALMDLDYFKAINDNYGHTVGDKMLALVGERLNEFLSEKAIPVHLGGDEFALIINYRLSDGQLDSLLNNLTTAIAKPSVFDGYHIYPSISTGVCRYQSGYSSDQLISEAGEALGYVKEHGRGAVKMYNQNLREAARRENIIESKLRDAIIEKQICVFYLPKVSLSTGAVVGAEALLRWHDQELGDISALELLKAAESTMQISALSRIVLEQVLSNINFLQEDHPHLSPISINLHPYQLQNPEEFLKLLSLLKVNGVNNEDLILEITERCIIGPGSERVPELLTNLSDLGFKLSMDDFGVGFASIAQLKKLPISEVKIDQSLVQEMLVSIERESMVRTTIDLGAQVGADVVAEGVETPEQCKHLQALGCRIAQGYFFSPAIPLDTLSEMMAKSRPFADKI